MIDIVADVDNWLNAGVTEIVLATVIQTWGSAPRKVGAKMAMTADGLISGSVSGGCVEGAVVDAGLEVLETGKPQLLHFGVADETAWDVGLACGGNIDIFVELLDRSAYAYVRDIIGMEKAGGIVTYIRAPEPLLGQTATFLRDDQTGSISGLDMDNSIRDQIRQATGPQRYSLATDTDIFVDLYRPAPTLIMVGGVHVAIALSDMAKTLGYKTLVIDPRRAFGNETRFPDVDRLIQKWPQKALADVALTADTAAALLTHDPKIDDPALEILLKSPAFYIGALGSKKTHAKRLDRLEQIGFDYQQIARIHAPIGLPIGAYNPEEIALSIMAEIVAVRRGAVESNA